MDKLKDLESELRVAQELLYHVLAHVGEPVVVTRKNLEETNLSDRGINIEMNKEDDTIILSVSKIV